MKFGKKIVTLAATAALIAGPAIVATAPAQAATPKASYSGTTLISFKKQYAMVFKKIAPVAPGKFIGSKMTFKVTNVTGAGVLNAGGFKIGTATFVDPVIKINQAKKTAKVYFYNSGVRHLIMTAEHFKIKADGVDGQVWQGDAHLTKDKAVVEDLNYLLGTDILTPNAGIGQIRVTIMN